MALCPSFQREDQKEKEMFMSLVCDFIPWSRARVANSKNVHNNNSVNSVMTKREEKRMK
jgi:hypothetical protein